MKKRIGVVMGGISSEREVSLNSGKAIIENLDKTQYDVKEVIIDKSEDALNIKDIDFAFIALHGKFGEDGTIQSILEASHIPYNGCSSLSSHMCMNKDIAKKVLAFSNILTPNWVLLDSPSNINYKEIEKLGYPMVVKPNNGGSSIATNIVHDKKELEQCIKNAFSVDEEVLIEEYIQGEEYTVCILGKEALPTIKIESDSVFFDFKSKYDNNGAKEIIQYDNKIEEKIQSAALKSFKALKCKTYGRVDLIAKDDKIYVLEINTIPGMTKNSLFPKSAKSYGLNYTQLLNRIINLSLN